MPEGGRLTFSAQVCLDFVSKNSKAPPPAWARALSVCRLAVGLTGQRQTVTAAAAGGPKRRRGEGAQT